MFVGSGISSIVLLISGTFFTQKSTITLADLCGGFNGDVLAGFVLRLQKKIQEACVDERRRISVMYFPSAGMVNRPRILSAEAFQHRFHGGSRELRGNRFSYQVEVEAVFIGYQTIQLYENVVGAVYQTRAVKLRISSPRASTISDSVSSRISVMLL